MTVMPSLFVSHGSPMMVLERETPTHSFLSTLGGELPRPRAILSVTAHWNTRIAAVGAAARPETVHDFYGFPPQLYALRYPAPGEPALAAEVAQRLQAAGFAVGIDDARGLDHGTWNPLMLMYPAADIPVVQLAVQPYEDGAHHLRLGEALRPLREDGVLVLGSGSATHDLRGITDRDYDGPARPYVAAFDDWLHDAVTEDRRADLADFAEAPEAGRNHPTPEHFLPLLVAAGAATPGRAGRCLHRAVRYGVLSLAAYAWD